MRPGKRSLACALAMLCFGAAYGEQTKVSSPNGQLSVTVDVEGGEATYSVVFAGNELIGKSPLGLETNEGSLSRGLKYVGSRTDKYTDEYSLDRIKKSHVVVEANKLTVSLTGEKERPMDIEFVIEDNALAFRYILPKKGETGSLRIMSEATSFRFAEGTTTFLSPQSDAMIGWKRTKPSYEEEYRADRPMAERSQYGHGYVFPCLFRVGDKGWALVSETGVSSRYCGSHLSDYANGLYTVAYPMAEENNGNGTAEPGIALPGETPWRTISFGKNAGEAADQTITWDVVRPLWQSEHKYSYGKGTWSWILWQDKSINSKDQKTFIDFAQKMGYKYVLIDNFWDRNMGRDGMKELADYGRARGVSLVVWYSSSGYWNDITQGPTNLMDRSFVRKAEMKWLKSIGAAGIKVDFFGGDKQETMRLYEDILSDADDAGLAVVFHGTTLPRGWERMYPNYVGSEAVLASENLIFQQHFCDVEPFNTTMHPFVRNAVGCMEFGGSFMNKRMSRGNDRGNTRKSSDVMELAQAVLFQNPVQFFALAPNNLTDAPQVCMDFLRDVPTTWDETHIVDGYPGKYVVMQRRHGDTWYVVAANATAETIKLDVQLPFATGATVGYYYDDAKKGTTLTQVKMGKKTGKIAIAPNCGAVFVGPQAGSSVTK